ncbi:MAG TPA: ABC transporter permease [Allosphingosinicella sp.]|nr:ABC transporter permease [Allosphingosinicella sp.]
MGLFEAAWVIARRDFVATVYSRSFILFLLVPLIVFSAAMGTGYMAQRNDRSAAQPVVALIADSATVEALGWARARLVAGTAEQSLPPLRPVAPAENVRAQAARLLADEQDGYSAVLSGTLERPVLTGPPGVEDGLGAQLQLVIDMARRDAAFAAAGGAPPRTEIRRVVTAEAAGNLKRIRRNIAQTAQTIIFGVTVMLATLLLSNLAEEKSNKVIEVLAAAVPLDSVFLGKLLAMLGISMVGMALWSGTLGLLYLFVQALQDWMALPDAAPAVGWPAFLLLVLVYYSANYMLLGALFLGIGGQASNIREIQTLSMPVTLLQVFVFLLAMSAVGGDGGAMMWTAYILPFSSPLAMVAHAAQHASPWPHLAALAWQALWVVLIIRASSRLFRATVLKSSPGGAFFSLASLLGRKPG